MSLTEGIFQRSNDLGAAKILDGNNAYNKIYTVVGIDKTNKKPAEAKRITNGLMNALKVANEISAEDNILVSYIFGGSPEQNDFTNVKHKDFLRAYQKGKMVKNADANKVDAKAQTFINSASVNKNKGAENIKLQSEPKEEPQEKEVTKENPVEDNKEVEKEINTSTTDNSANMETVETSKEDSKTNIEQQKKKAQYSKKVFNVLQNAGIDTAPLTTDKSGVKKINYPKVRGLVQQLKKVPGVAESLKEELEKLDKEYEQYLKD